MNGEKNFFHVFTLIVFNLTFLIVAFSCDNPPILFIIFLYYIVIAFLFKRAETLKVSILCFLPLALITIAINMLFSTKGNTILFYAFGKEFTLESMVYALVFSFRLLLVILIFAGFGMMIDSDSAAAFFSGTVPKTTLTLMIGIKLLPNMSERLKNLMTVYSVRGVEFNKGSLKNKIKNSIPVLSILLEDSLEASFDIGEAAYVRGFLSGKRTVYDKKKFLKKDYIILFLSCFLLLAYVYTHIKEYDKFDVYSNGISGAVFINNYILFIITVIILNSAAITYFFRKME